MSLMMKTGGLTSPWLKAYPAGVPADIDAFNIHRWWSDGESFKIQGPCIYSFMGKEITGGPTTCRLRLAPICTWVWSKGPGSHHDAQRAAVSGGSGAILRHRLRGGQCESALHRREPEHQLKDSGAKAIVIVEKICHAGQVPVNTPVKHVVFQYYGRPVGVAQGRAGQL
jgi:long-chain acyl-CoA synthetase